jgi:hypothetical protein
MSFSSYSLTPASNTTLAGLSIAENTTNPASINNGLRQLMADGKELANALDAIDLSDKADIASPAFTGQPTVATRGAVIHHNNASNASGKVFVQASGAATPTMANGDILLEY